MTVLVLAGAVAGAGVLMVLRVLAINEVRSYLRNRVLANVEATIASLPRDRQDEWGEEWRAEAATLMPLTAALFARGLRRSAAELGVAERFCSQLCLSLVDCMLGSIGC